MEFQERLNQYIEEIHCTGKELARNSGISETVLSRYRKGERIPPADSEYLEMLAKGIVRTAKENGVWDTEVPDVLRILQETLKTEEDTETFLGEKLDLLLRELNVNVSQMAAFLHYDASYISKIRTGKRMPSHPQEFVENVCGYLVKNFSSEKERKDIALLIGCGEEELAQTDGYRRRLKEWLRGAACERIDYVSGFLRKVDSFELDDYIRAIHFDTFKVPKIPFQLPVSRHYYGLKEMREGELDFLKHTVFAKSRKPLYLCSDMPVEDMAADEEFAKKYMFGLAMVLKKGLHIHIVHDVERPMKDMMLGLENWVPLYMTGQISPYYLKGVQNKVYSHLHFCSGQAAMTGDCISGHHDLAHYYLTSRKEEVAVCRKNMEFLLKKAHPLMDIYREEKRKKLYAFLTEDSRKEGRRRRILAAPPLFSIPAEVLAFILKRQKTDRERREQILENWKNQKEWMEAILSHSVVEDELSEMSETEYEKYPAALPLAECFFEEDIRLTYEEYQSCIRAAQEYASGHENYRFRLTQAKGFHNIQITCHEGKWCMVSKNKAPAIHFVIHHPKLRYALENVSLPIIDQDMEMDRREET
ncbi:MAG: helix-turn-helix transcriptional regulator [Eubacteriales bacterium]|nr:helix-turn-helix transcriptional regulator [Eubacteriales bacterium]